MITNAFIADTMAILEASIPLSTTKNLFAVKSVSRRMATYIAENDKTRTRRRAMKLSKNEAVEALRQGAALIEAMSELGGDDEEEEIIGPQLREIADALEAQKVPYAELLEALMDAAHELHLGVPERFRNSFEYKIDPGRAKRCAEILVRAGMLRQNTDGSHDLLVAWRPPENETGSEPRKASESKREA